MAWLGGLWLGVSRAALLRKKHDFSAPYCFGRKLCWFDGHRSLQIARDAAKHFENSQDLGALRDRET